MRDPLGRHFGTNRHCSFPGVTTTISRTITLPGQTTTIRGYVVTVTKSNHIRTCGNPASTFTPAVQPPSDYTWGCPPGFVCVLPKSEGCDVWAGSPPDDYVCQSSECLPSPSFTRVTVGLGDDVASSENSIYPALPDFFNLSPLAFGLRIDVFSEEIDVVLMIDPDGKQTLTAVTAGHWASQTSITTQPAPETSSPAKKVKRSIFRRDASTVPATCYNECNNCYIEAQGH